MSGYNVGEAGVADGGGKGASTSTTNLMQPRAQYVAEPITTFNTKTNQNAASLFITALRKRATGREQNQRTKPKDSPVQTVHTPHNEPKKQEQFDRSRSLLTAKRRTGHNEKIWVQTQAVMTHP